MKSYGALRKVMLIVLLSILGSYCIGADQVKNGQENMFEHAIQVTYDVVISVGSYCCKLWSELADFVMTMFGKNNDQMVKIQLVDDNVHGNDGHCTDGANDCKYLNRFFNDTYFKDVDNYGSMDLDNSSHWDVDVDPMVLIEDDPMP
ncbi:MAG: hypothetical protein Q8Q60_01955 [Candidatus Chromulinivorax sp.]|nr:hypothetical protein [Candidatus Chromulinivorax sp.]